MIFNIESKGSIKDLTSSKIPIYQRHYRLAYKLSK